VDRRSLAIGGAAAAVCVAVGLALAGYPHHSKTPLSRSTGSTTTSSAAPAAGAAGSAGTPGSAGSAGAGATASSNGATTRTTTASGATGGQNPTATSHTFLTFKPPDKRP